MTNRIPITFTARERRQFYGRAKKSGLSFSNYVRQLLGLPPLQHGGARKRKKPTTDSADTERTASTT